MGHKHIGLLYNRSEKNVKLDACMSPYISCQYDSSLQGDFLEYPHAIPILWAFSPSCDLFCPIYVT